MGGAIVGDGLVELAGDGGAVVVVEPLVAPADVAAVGED
jgi:hypothetical protein